MGLAKNWITFSVLFVLVNLFSYINPQERMGK